MDLKDVVHGHDAEQKVERNAEPSHPLTEVHHPPYCKDNNPYLFHQGKFVTFLDKESTSNNSGDTGGVPDGGARIKVKRT